MRYLGGKAKIAKTLAAGIREAHPGATKVWDAFCGGLSVSAAFADCGFEVLATDQNEALICTYSAVKAGWLPPEAVTYEDWSSAKALPDTAPLKAVCGFGCSFGGKWFGGYARGEGRNWAAECRRSLLRDVPKVSTFACVSFFDADPEPENDLVIYCDPPYAGTTGYRQGVFDTDRFWRQCDAWHDCGVPVYVSEYAAPPHWYCIWEREQKTTVSLDKTPKVAVERLFARG